MQDNKGYYKTLGITDEDKNTLSDEQLTEKIKKNFRKLSIENHPDKFSTASQEEQKKHEDIFKQVNEAYTAIGDTEKRKQYDASNNPFDAFDFSGFRSPFGDNPFGMHFGGGNFWTINMGGSDIKVLVTITLEEVMHGAEKSITYNRSVRQEENGKVVMVLKPETIPITLYRGLEDGKLIRFANMGSESPMKGKYNGDLFIQISIAKHPKYERDGINLISTIEVGLNQAWCGDEVVIETLSGRKLKMKIPPMTQQGRMLRVPNEGLPTQRSVTGDLFVKVLYKMPKDITAEQAELLKKFYEIEKGKA